MNLLRINIRKINLRLALVLTLLLVAPGVFAHTHPEHMTPAPNSTVAAPANITIQFNGALEPKFSKITVTDSTGQVVSKDPSSVGGDAKIMTVPLPPLPPGVYKVTWVGVSVDTHRAEGSYTFTIK